MPGSVVARLGRPSHSTLALIVGLGTALAILGSALWRRGYLLSGDMVFVPREAWSRWLWGADGSVPRHVPSDPFVAILSRALPGDLVQDLVLGLLVVLAVWGAGRLGSDVLHHRVSIVAVGLGYAWTPFLYERLILGQWALLIGWAVLPWVARAAASSGVVAGLWVAAGSLGGPSAWMLVSGMGLAVSAFARGPGAHRRTGLIGLTSAVCALPWLVPSILNASVGGDPAAFAAFAARADTALGTLGSLLAGGGVWNARVAPPGRDSLAVAGLTLLLLGVAAWGMVCLGRRYPRPAWWTGLLVVSGLGLVLALLGTFAPTRGVLEHALAWAPAVGLLRDGQKFVAGWTLLVALGLGMSAEVLASRAAGTLRRVGPVLVMLLPLALVPALGAGVGGRLQPAAYPDGWRQAAQAVAAQPGPVLVLPWQPYRAFEWNRSAPSLDPARRWLPGEVFGSDTLVVGGTAVAGDDPWSAALQPFAASQSDLISHARALGARWVLVERRTPGSEGVTIGRLAVSTPDLQLFAVDPTGPAPDLRVSSWAVAAGWLVTVLFVTGLGATVLTRRARRPC